MAPSRGKGVSGEVDGVSVKDEVRGDIVAAVRAQLAILQSRAEESPDQASPTDALLSTSAVAERPQRRRTLLDQLDPGKGWSAFELGRVGQRHYAGTAPSARDFSNVNLEELKELEAILASLQARIDGHYSSAERPSAEADDAMQVDLFDGPEASATLRSTSATQTVGVYERECIVALQNALVDMLDDEDLALQQEAEEECERDEGEGAYYGGLGGGLGGGRGGSGVGGGGGGEGGGTELPSPDLCKYLNIL
ncbi:hypothetical protein T492DRAFT_1151769 [Pavlovales sp. CCMP2436]|nr:hypothetical protein T492DRAFT_1151769 [Pavlovales sp. CCMP2436]